MFKILNNSKIITVIFVAVSVITSGQQIITDNIIILDQPDQGNKVYMADERIEFLPGYSFTAGNGNRMEAYIHKSISYSNLYSTGAFNSLTLDATKEIVNLGGQLDVNQLGAANYTFPIELPVGSNNFHPSFSIGYNSLSPNGSLGMGWSLNGLSAIQLSKQQLYRDEENRGLKLDGTDKFEIDNNRLYAENGVYGQHGTTYSTEVDNFSRTTSYGNGITPDFFTVETKEGVIMEYGNLNSSFIQNNEQIKVIYFLNKVTDQNGNYIEYFYENIASELRLIEVQYGGVIVAGASEQILKIKFDYEIRKDKNTWYFGGAIINNNSLLKRIAITKSDDVVYSYLFDYGYNDASYLKNITKLSGNEEEINPIHFKYGDDDLDFTNHTITSFQNANPNTDYYAGGDYNGDGLMDLFAKEYYFDENNLKVYDKWVVYKNNGDYTFENFAEGQIISDYLIYNDDYLFSIGRQTQHNLDFTGNGRTDVVTFQILGDGVNTHQINNFQIFEFSENGVSQPTVVSLSSNTQTFFNPQKGLFMGDFTGDGLTDIIIMSFNQSDMIYHGILINFEGGGQSGTGFFIRELNLDGLRFLNAAHDVAIGDFNGDGKSDLAVLYNNSFEVFDFTRDGIGSNSYNENKIAHINSPFPQNFNHAHCKLRVADFNGDGNSDYLVFKENGDALIVHSDGLNQLVNFKPFTFQGTPNVSNTGGSLMHNDTHSGLRLMDINKNGKIDILHFYRNHAVNPPEFHIDTYISDGIDFEFNRVENQFLSGSHLASVPVMDFNGDGFPSHFNLNSITRVAFLRSFNSNNSKHNLLTRIKDEFLNETRINYNFLAQDEDYVNLTNPLGSSSFVLRNQIPTIPIVKTVQITSPIGGMNETIYAFRGGKSAFRGIGFLGFMENEITDLVNEKKVLLEKTILRSPNQNAHPNLFVPFQVKSTTLDLNNSPIISEEFTPNLTVFSGIRFNLEIASTKSTNHLYNNITEIDYEYDNVKNIKLENQRLYADNVVVDNKLNEYSYSSFGSSLGFDNRLTALKTTVTLKNEQPYSTEESYDYDFLTGNLIQKKTFLNTPFEVTQEFEHDAFGNVVKSTTKASSVQDRVSEIEYDNQGRLPIKSINELGQEGLVEYHPLFDKPILITDADGLISTSTYDNFGRLQETVDKYGILSSIVREWVNTNPSISSSNPTQADDIMFKVTKTRQGKPSNIIHYNRIGQPRMQEVQGLNAPAFSITTYNNKGQVVAVTEPFFQGASTIALSETTYDEYSRVSSVTSSGETVEYTYDLENGLRKTTVFKPDGNTYISYQDASGNLFKTEGEDASLIEYTYFSHGGVKEIKINQEVVAESEYDVIGRQSKLIDINAGTMTYDYNEFGEIIQSVNSNGEIKSYLYDDFGRLHQTNVGGFVVDYEYVESGNGLNQIERILTSDHEQIFEYDGLNRVIKTTEIINGEYFEFEYIYNSLNQIEQVTYPSGFMVTNLYDNNGYLVEVRGQNDQILWQGVKQDAFGRFVEYKKGDGVTTELSFDAFQNLVAIEAGNVQQHLYFWDEKTGNLLQREDLIKNLYEEFKYDNLNRLTKVQDLEVAMGPPPTVFSEVEYEANGNISYKTDAGEYVYHPVKPNAVTDVTNNEQNINWQTQDIAYNVFNKASTISEGAFELQFQYGQDNQRRKTTLLENNVVALEKYFVGLYEKEVAGNITRHINYIMAGDGMTAIVIDEEENANTTSETYFTYKDHLGSIVALTDVSGDIIMEQSFDAWGRYRNSNDWTYNNINESPTWLRGYTGHEHLPHFDLINMNGRIYDPILGRMLSPDKYIQDPMSSQSYNRYSYVWNNPLRYTDPSGDAVVAGIIIGAAVGAYIGGAAVNNTINITEWEWNARTASGIISGAIVGAFGGAYIGAALAGKLGVKAMAIAKLNAATIKSGLVSGGLNMMYNYEEGQSFGTSMGYFGSGFVGGAIGVDLVAPLIGMAASGVGNMVVLGVDSGGEATTREYAQKFVSGALNAYAGISIFSNNVSYMKMSNGDYIGGSKVTAKAWRAGWINQASDFAYSSQDAFNNRNIRERILMFGAAGGSSIIGGLFEDKTIEMKSKFWKGVSKYGMKIAEGGSDYLLQQTIQGSINHNSGYFPFNYDGGWNKTLIFSYKSLFYSLAQ